MGSEWQRRVVKAVSSSPHLRMRQGREERRDQAFSMTLLTGRRPPLARRQEGGMGFAGLRGSREGLLGKIGFFAVKARRLGQVPLLVLRAAAHRQTLGLAARKAGGTQSSSLAPATIPSASRASWRAGCKTAFPSPRDKGGGIRRFFPAMDWGRQGPHCAGTFHCAACFSSFLKRGFLVGEAFPVADWMRDGICRRASLVALAVWQGENPRRSLGAALPSPTKETGRPRHCKAPPYPQIFVATWLSFAVWIFYFAGGGGRNRIRTCEGNASRFTVCPR